MLNTLPASRVSVSPALREKKMGYDYGAESASRHGTLSGLGALWR